MTEWILIRRTPPEQSSAKQTRAEQSKAGQSSAVQFKSANSAKSTLGHNICSRQFKQSTAPVQAELIRDLNQCRAFLFLKLVFLPRRWRALPQVAALGRDVYLSVI